MKLIKKKIKDNIENVAIVVLVIIAMISFFWFNPYRYLFQMPKEEINALIIIDDGYLYFYNTEKETMELMVNPFGEGILFIIDGKYFEVVPVAIPSMCGVKIPLENFMAINKTGMYDGEPQTIRVAIKGRDTVFTRGKNFCIPGLEEKERKGLESIKRLEKRGFIFVVPELPVPFKKNKNMII